MKKFLFLSIIVALLGCKKEIPMDAQQLQGITHASGTSNQSNFYYAGCDILNLAGMQGISVSADVVKFSGGNFYMKSWWVAFNFTDTNGLQKWTQWGYATHKTLGNITILTVWQFTGGQRQLDIPITSLNIVPLNYGGKTTFSIYRVPGTTKWHYARDGIDISEVDLEATSIGYRGEIKIEAQASVPGKWGNQINVKQISSENIDQTWSLIPTATYGGNFYTDTGLSIWPIAGHNQDSALAPAEMNMGGNGKTISWQSILW